MPLPLDGLRRFHQGKINRPSSVTAEVHAVAYLARDIEGVWRVPLHYAYKHFADRRHLLLACNSQRRSIYPNMTIHLLSGAGMFPSQGLVVSWL
jgi:hypothetical protein